MSAAPDVQAFAKLFADPKMMPSLIQDEQVRIYVEKWAQRPEFLAGTCTTRDLAIRWLNTFRSATPREVVNEAGQSKNVLTEIDRAARALDDAARSIKIVMETTVKTAFKNVAQEVEKPTDWPACQRRTAELMGNDVVLRDVQTAAAFYRLLAQQYREMGLGDSTMAFRYAARLPLLLIYLDATNSIAEHPLSEALKHSSLADKNVVNVDHFKEVILPAYRTQKYPRITAEIEALPWVKRLLPQS